MVAGTVSRPGGEQFIFFEVRLLRAGLQLDMRQSAVFINT